MARFDIFVLVILTGVSSHPFCPGFASDYSTKPLLDIVHNNNYRYIN